MEQDSIKYLPSEIISNILSRLDVRTVASSKCVCKPWLNLLKSDEFVKLHFSRSGAALAVWLIEYYRRCWCTVFELKHQIDDKSSHEDHYNHPIKLDFPVRVAVEGSANGLLFLHPFDERNKTLYVCNPMTREYIELRCFRGSFVFGFGASRISGQHKVVRIKRRDSDCHVYTLGTGWWRRIKPPCASFRSCSYPSDAFVNGNLYWLGLDLNDSSWWTCCFDLETECFSTFSLPPVGGTGTMGLSVLRDCLCVCEQPSENDDEIALWLMKDYGDDKSWSKEYVIDLTPAFYRRNTLVYPLYVFDDGDVLMLRDRRDFLYYSKTKTTQGIGVFGAGGVDFVTSMVFTPSFLSLKSFPMENVISL